MLYNAQNLDNIDPTWVSLAIIDEGVPRYDTSPLFWFNKDGLPLSKQELFDLGYYGVISEEINYDPDKEKIIENQLDISTLDEANRTLTKTYNVVPFSAHELSLMERHRRNVLLENTDSLVLVDRWESYDDIKKENIRTYRQLLRDVPSQENFPYNIDWPVLNIAEENLPPLPSLIDVSQMYL